ncbi:MAG: elongation factor P [Ignavibacteriaceae bacterium]|jgi:translation elongation factor P (EF-P)|nr:MAG: elongation factor P [Chlorobiota bacterium]KXK06134.1 MAG: translation elongation factor P [Chlorobi bacterium OLB4]MBV6398563.1 Elongation factor P [Ignavibacteria bacterium]MCC6885797.1 elongation factor P [Ignavibacteriales bacterium]MCE7953008.1 elongation factor P [Chlorobi bacterium CHB7]MDL1887154.1 elongation factor P [Ignavibacteria bacterium CHB1]MEB2329209.1 elongation factor P [Ignavibacteriaceae bacterium]OQY78047.1 MAG: elongation factor P [Ignavibacteriales bacterium U
MATTSDLKVGLIINFKNELHNVMFVEHRTPGNLRAFYQVKMRNLKNGKTFEHRFRSGEEIQIERVESKSFQFLYKDGNELFFMDNETYDQVNINEDLIGEQSNFIKEGQEVQIQFHNGNPLAIVMPPNVELKIVSAPPGVKGNTATNATKQAEVETGAIVNVPMFINDGDIIRVETRTGAYIERVKN